MANLTQFTVTINAPASISTRSITLSGKVVDDQGNVLGDFTGANAVIIPQALNSLTPAQAQEFALMVATFLLGIKFPTAIK